MYHKWTCSCYGKQFNELPMSYAIDAPDPYFALSEDERESRGMITSDACVIDNSQFFLLGCIEIPVIGLETPFVWNAWVSLSQKSFERIGELWETDIRENEPPFFGRLTNAISIYRDTFALKSSIQLRNHGMRPSITLEATDHPLAIEQRNGISFSRIEEIAALSLPVH
jgi:hypothetical protein